MAFQTFTRSMAPTVGRKISTPAVAVGENGRLLCTSAASKALEGCTAASLAYDPATGAVLITGIGAVPKGKEDGYWPLNVGKKSKQYGLSAAGLLHYAQYDAKAAGNQTYEATINMAKHTVSFVLPKETPAPRPKVARKSRKAAAVPAPAVQPEPVEDEFEAA